MKYSILVSQMLSCSIVMQSIQIFYGGQVMFVATCLIARFGLQEKFEFFNCKGVYAIENCIKAKFTLPYLIVREGGGGCLIVRGLGNYYFFSCLGGRF